jgi:nucleotide-binding universal stress UspA family protein
MIRTILLPVDGSTFSEHALPVALDAARRSGARLHIVHVHEPVSARVSPEGLGFFDARLDATLRDQEQEYLTSLRHRCMEKAGVSPCIDLLDGPVSAAVSAYAAEVEADLVVMTTHGRGGISRAWVGSVADALMRRAAVPILLVRPRDEAVDWSRTAAPRHMLIPLDGSELSAAVMPPALDLAALGDARITLLRVVLPVPFVVGPNAAVPTFLATGGTDALEDARAYVERVATPLRERGLEVAAEALYHSTPATAILDYAAGAGIDAIAMATHGRGGWSRIALGSVADKVMRGTMMPVLVYRPSGRSIDASGTTQNEVEEPCAAI